MRIKVAVGYLLVAVAAVFAVWYIYMRIAPLAVREDATQGAAYRKVLVTGTTISSLYEASYRANIYLQDPSVDNLEAYDRAIDTVYGHIDSLCRLQIPPEQIGILEEIGLSIEDLEENAQALGEEIDVLSDDLADVESEVFGEDEDEDGEDYDDDWFEVECPTCGETVYIDEEMLDEGETTCPGCGETLEFDLDIEGEGCECGCGCEQE